MAPSPQIILPNTISAGQLIDAGPVQANYVAIRDAYNAHTHPGGDITTFVGFPAYEYAYTEFTGTVTLTATADASATTIVTAGAVTFDGATAVWVEFFAPLSGTGTVATNANVFNLFMDGVDQGRIADFNTVAAVSQSDPIQGARRLTPSAGSRTFSIRGWSSAGTGTVTAGTGGAATFMPGYIRVTKA